MVNKIKEARKLLRKKDKEWANTVKARYHKKCAVCSKKERLNAHHIIPRQIKQFRHDIRNGIALCPKHHRFSFELSAHQNPLIFIWCFHYNMPEIYEEVWKMCGERKW